MSVTNPIRFVRRAARNSPWLVMSVLFHAILLVWLGLLVIRHEKEKGEPVDRGIVISRSIPEDPPLVLPPLETVDRTLPPEKPIELVDFDHVVPDPIDFVPPEDLTKEVGNPDPLDSLPLNLPPASSAIGVGGPGGRGTTVSPIGTIRRPYDPTKPIGTGEGGRDPVAHTVGIDKAVREGLLWLCRHQNKDGSWGALSMRERCDPSRPCFDPKLQANAHYDEGLTGLALLAFLGAGISHKTQAALVENGTGTRYAAGDVVERGLRWLRERQNPDGSFSRERAFMYNEALATMALSEAYGMTRAAYWKGPAQKGVEFLQRAQRLNPSGSGRWGWRYASREDVEDFRKGTGDEAYQREMFDSDTSVTAWCVMALKSAEMCGLTIERESMDGALAFSDFVTANDGLVGYLDAKGAGGIVTGPYSDRFTYHPTTMSALGMCIRIFAKHDAADPFLDLAARRIVADLPAVSKDRASVDYYYWYYASLALFQVDGESAPRRTGRYWNPWNDAMVKALIALQDHEDRTCGEGGWLEPDRWGSYSGAGALYDTALNVLTLEVTFRYPNAFGSKRN